MRAAAAAIGLSLMGTPLGAALCQTPDPKPPPIATDASAQAAMAIPPFLSDEMVNNLAQRIWKQRNAMDTLTNPVPGVPRKRTIRYNPSSTNTFSDEIDTVMGYPTSITFIDITGARWPIPWKATTNVYAEPALPKDAASGSRGDNRSNQSDDSYLREAEVVAAVTTGHGFRISNPMKGPDGNTIDIMTESPGPRGGMNVMLEGARSAIPFLLRGLAQGGIYDSSVTVQVMARGPNAAPLHQPFDDTPALGTVASQEMLDGHPPASAVPLDAIGLPADRIRAWKTGRSYWLRTDVTIISPAPSYIAAGNGVSLYQLSDSPVVVVSDNGVTKTVYLRDR